MMYYFLWIVNFCQVSYEKTKGFIETSVNSQLEGRVLYYAMYSRKDVIVGSKSYTCLYDYTSLWSRLSLILFNQLYTDYYKEKYVFMYDEVYSNLEDITTFLIDAVVLSYIKDGKQEDIIISYKNDSDPTVETVSAVPTLPSFVYAVMVDDTGNEYDFTKEYNMYSHCIINSPLTVYDSLMIFDGRHRTSNSVDINNAYLKVMMDNNFTELLFKGSDQLYV